MPMVRIPQNEIWDRKGKPFTHDVLIQTDLIVQVTVAKADASIDQPYEATIMYRDRNASSFVVMNGHAFLERLEA